MVPVLVCTRTRLDTKSVFLQRGQVMRKEGEKRRKKTGKTYFHIFSVFFTFKPPQEDDRVSKRRRTSRGEPGAFMTTDTWKIFNAFMRKEAAKGKSLERNCWRFLEKSQVQAVKKKRSLLFSVRTGIIHMFVYIPPYIYSWLLLHSSFGIWLQIEYQYVVSLWKDYFNHHLFSSCIEETECPRDKGQSYHIV